MKKIIIALVAIFSIAYGYTQDCWTVDIQNSQLKQTLCSGKTISIPLWYRDMGLTNDQIKEILVEGKSIKGTEKAYSDEYAFHGPFVYYREKSEIYLINREQKQKPEPTIFISENERFSWKMNILFLIFNAAFICFYIAAFKRKKYKWLLFLSAAIIVGLIIRPSLFTDQWIRVGIALLEVIGISIVISNIIDKVFDWDVGFLMGILLAVVLIATLNIDTCNTPVFSQNVIELGSLLLVPALGLLISCFAWTYSYKESAYTEYDEANEVG